MLITVLRVVLLAAGAFCAVPFYADAYHLKKCLDRRTLPRLRRELAWAAFFTILAAIGVIGWRP